MSLHEFIKYLYKSENESPIFDEKKEQKKENIITLPIILLMIAVYLILMLRWSDILCYTRRYVFKLVFRYQSTIIFLLRNCIHELDSKYIIDFFFKRFYFNDVSFFVLFDKEILCDVDVFEDDEGVLLRHLRECLLLAKHCIRPIYYGDWAIGLRQREKDFLYRLKPVEEFLNVSVLNFQELWVGDFAVHLVQMLLF